jgi:hypothetical protein
MGVPLSSAPLKLFQEMKENELGSFLERPT